MGKLNRTLKKNFDQILIERLLSPKGQNLSHKIIILIAVLTPTQRVQPFEKIPGLLSFHGSFLRQSINAKSNGTPKCQKTLSTNIFMERYKVRRIKINL